jgi:hypothetical protein
VVAGQRRSQIDPLQTCAYLGTGHSTPHFMGGAPSADACTRLVVEHQQFVTGNSCRSSRLS